MLRRSRTTRLGAAAAVVLALLACKKFSETTAETSSVGAVSTGQLAGTYRIASASNPAGGSYAGTVAITSSGDHYDLEWSLTSNESYGGVGIEEGSVLGVGWGTGSGYGVAVYQVAGGKLTGRWATKGSGPKVGREVLQGPSGLNGSYAVVEGSSPITGKSYGGTVSIAPRGSTYSVAWSLSSGEKFRGVGMLEGTVFVVGWGLGGGAAGVVTYQASGTGLSGSWAQPGSGKLGTENLQRT